MENNNPYRELSFEDTVMLIRSKGRSLDEDPLYILQQVNSIIALANHFRKNFECWQHERLKATVQHKKAIEELELEMQALSELDDKPPLAN